MFLARSLLAAAFSTSLCTEMLEGVHHHGPMAQRSPDLGVFSHLAWIKMTHEASMVSGTASFPFLLCFYKAEIEVSITCAAPPSAGRPREAATVCECPRENFGWEPAVAYGLPEPHGRTLCVL